MRSEQNRRSFFGELSRELVVGLLVFLMVAGGGLVWSLGVLGGIVIVVITLVLLASLQFRFVDRVRERIEAWRFRRVAPQLTEELISYVAHLRDVNRTFPRVLAKRPTKDRSTYVRETIRRDVLEPIRGFFTTPAGREVKVVWFRPARGGTHLRMHEQVGHTEEGQLALRLKIGGSIAGKAFVDGETVWSGECEIDPAFQEVEQSKATGSLVCVPIARGTKVTGVLSVLANWPDAFWLSDIAYLEALATAIAALEALEKAGKSRGSAK